MRKITAILFETEIEYDKYANAVCEKLANIEDGKVFCGIWGEIRFHHGEVLAAISSAINHYIDQTDKSEILFGCCKKDYPAVLAQLHREQCLTHTVSIQEL
ncbi:MAG: hypothetical protein IJD39_06245 [Clostridia bacterium]|nr:hypothetical protein [Clostridia bacterium]